MKDTLCITYELLFVMLDVMFYTWDIMKVWGHDTQTTKIQHRRCLYTHVTDTKCYLEQYHLIIN